MSLTVTWLGHSGFLLQTPQHGVVIDPFLSGNPKAPFGWQELTSRTTHIALTHGHGDHIGDTPALAEASGAPVVAIVELCQYVQAAHGVQTTEMLNHGGSVNLGHGTTLTLVPAWHSTGAGQGAEGEVGTYTGMPGGFVLTTPTHTLYHAGDTAAFGDMALIAELYQPHVVCLPIGGRFTMDAKAAAWAAKKFFSKAQHIVPMHFGTFPILAQTPDDFVKAAKGLPVRVLTPGQPWQVPLPAVSLTPTTPHTLNDLEDVA